MISAGPYPIAKSPEKYPGRRRKELDLDRWAMAGNLRWMWIVGTTWVSVMAASQELANTVYRQTQAKPHHIMSFDLNQVVRTLKARVDSGGMVLAVQDIYLQPIADFADLVLPAATWGEEDFARCNGERRLRLYSKIYDPPGEAKPDWWIAAQFAKRMGFDGYDWRDSNDVFEEAAKFSRGGVLNYAPLVTQARMEGKRGHDLLREFGTEGIQTPIRLEHGKLVGTKRLHDPTVQLPAPQGVTQHPKWLTAFNTHSGKAILHKSPWELFKDFYERITPKGDELWLPNGRINEIWQSGFDDKRKTYIMQRWPGNFLELHPQDAKARGIESGDLVVAESDDILVQTGGFYGVEDDDLSFTKLMENGHIKVGRGACTALAMVTDALKPGVAWMYFLWPGSSANSLVHAVPDPITNRSRFKLGKGRVRKIGESPHKRSLTTMSFAPRHII